MPSYHTTRRVEFHHTDAAGIIHFSAYFQFMEEAEHEFLRDRGLSVMMRDDEGQISWPRVSCQCDFRKPLRFEDIVDIEVSLVEQKAKSVTYRFLFNHNGQCVAEGRMTSVCCRIDPVAPPRSIAIPAWIVERLVSFTVSGDR